MRSARRFWRTSPASAVSVCIATRAVSGGAPAFVYARISRAGAHFVTPSVRPRSSAAMLMGSQRRLLRSTMGGAGRGGVSSPLRRVKSFGRSAGASASVADHLSGAGERRDRGCYVNGHLFSPRLRPSFSPLVARRREAGIAGQVRFCVDASMCAPAVIAIVIKRGHRCRRSRSDWRRQRPPS
jgi:hypothetical protein